MTMNLFSDGNLVVAAVLDKKYGLILGDRGYIGNHPAIAAGYLGNLAGSASDTISRDLTGHGLGVMAAVAENAAPSATAFTFQRVSASVGRRSFRRQVSDLLRVLDPSGSVRDPAAFAFDAATIRGNTMMDLIATVGATFTEDEDASGALDWATLRAAKNRIVGANNEVVPGNVVAVLEPRQWASLEDDIAVGASMSDAMTHAPEAYNALLLRKLGWQGRYFGVDIFTSPRVPVDDGEATGCIFTELGVVHADAEIQPNPAAAELLLDSGKLQIEFQRNAASFIQDVFYNSILGVAKGVDKAGCTITSTV